MPRGFWYRLASFTTLLQVSLRLRRGEQLSHLTVSAGQQSRRRLGNRPDHQGEHERTGPSPSHNPPVWRGPDRQNKGVKIGISRVQQVLALAPTCRRWASWESIDDSRRSGLNGRLLSADEGLELGGNGSRPLGRLLNPWLINGHEVGVSPVPCWVPSCCRDLRESQR